MKLIIHNGNDNSNNGWGNFFYRFQENHSPLGETLLKIWPKSGFRLINRH